MADLIASASADRVTAADQRPLRRDRPCWRVPGATVADALRWCSHRLRAGASGSPRRSATGVGRSPRCAHRATLEEAYHGADPGRGGVSAPSRHGRRDDRRSLTGARLREGPDRLRGPGARGVDQVPDRARLGNRRGGRSAGDRGFGLGPPGQQGSCSTARPAPCRKARRGGGDRRLLLRAPAAGRERQHHRPDHLAHRPDPGALSGTARGQGLVPWAKAGIIIKASTRQGSAYAAMMVTGSHGRADAVRLHPGPARSCRRRLRGVPALAAADALRRHASPATTRPTAGTGRRVGTATLAGLPQGVQVGLFTTSPQYAADLRSGEVERQRRPQRGDRCLRPREPAGRWPSGAWTGGDLGRREARRPARGSSQAAGAFTITGSGRHRPVGVRGGGRRRHRRADPHRHVRRAHRRWSSWGRCS